MSENQPAVKELHSLHWSPKKGLTARYKDGTVIRLEYDLPNLLPGETDDNRATGFDEDPTLNDALANLFGHITELESYPHVAEIINVTYTLPTDEPNPNKEEVLIDGKIISRPRKWQDNVPGFRAEYLTNYPEENRNPQKPLNFFSTLLKIFGKRLQNRLAKP